MRTIDNYIDKAREKTGATSDRNLAKILDIDNSSITHWRTKRSWPADDTISKLAELAGIPQDEALLELNAWRSTGETQNIYKRLIEKLNGVLTLLIIVFAALHSTPSYAAIAGKNTNPLLNHKYTLSHNQAYLFISPPNPFRIQACCKFYL